MERHESPKIPIGPKTQITVEGDFFPRGGFKTAYCKGALAWREGKNLTENPYPLKGNCCWYRQWERGWHGAESGAVTFKEVSC